MRYTQYIKDLNIKKPHEVLLKHIEEDLVYEMKRRGLWLAPPEWLGYPDIESWKNSSALNSLAFFCYEFAIVKRIPGLDNQLKEKDNKKKDNIDGIILLNIKNFLTELQQKQDRVGYAVGSNVNNAIKQLIEENPEIIRAQKLSNGKLDNKTVLTFLPADPTSDISDEKSLWDAIRHHTDWLMVRFEMLRISEKAQEKLSKIVCQLANCDIRSFRYHDLINLLKNDARAAWKSTYVASELDDTKAETDENEEEIPHSQWVKITHSDMSVEDFENWKELVSRIKLKINALERQNEIPKKVSTVFNEWVAYRLDFDEQPPKQVELARKLEIPPQTLNGYVKIIRKLFVADLIERNLEQAIWRTIKQKTIKLQDLDEKGKICNQTKLVFPGATTEADEKRLTKLLNSIEAWLDVRLRLAQMDELDAEDKLLKVINQLAEFRVVQFGELAKVMIKNAIAALQAFHQTVKTNLKTAVQKAIENKILTSKETALKSQTELSFSTVEPPVSREALSKTLYYDKAWLKVWLKLVRGERNVQDGLYQALCQLPNNNSRSFQYGDLEKILKETHMGGRYIRAKKATDNLA